MKATTEILTVMRAAIVPLDTKEARANYLAAGLSSMRYRWILLWSSKLDINVLYAAGLNDEHIDTALRHIVPSLTIEEVRPDAR